MSTPLPESLRDALGSLIPTLAQFGLLSISYETSASFGNFQVVFSGANRSLSITRDRGQFIVGGEREVLEPIGLWRTFSSVAELQLPLVRWLESQNAA